MNKVMLYTTVFQHPGAEGPQLTPPSDRASGQMDMAFPDGATILGLAVVTPVDIGQHNALIEEFMNACAREVVSADSTLALPDLTEAQKISAQGWRSAALGLAAVAKNLMMMAEAPAAEDAETLAGSQSRP